MSEYNNFSEEQLRAIAEQKVNFRLSVKIHTGVFIAVNILLFAINMIFTPSYLWIIFPFFGWLVGLVIHATSYIVWARGVYPMAKRGFIFHLVAYVFSMLFLFIINFYTLPTYWWVFWPAFFWGFALIIHFIAYMVYYRGKIDKNGELKSRKQRAVEREMEKLKKKMKEY